jgi:hypothetical protein
MGYAHIAQNVPPPPLGEPDGMPQAQGIRSGGSARDKLGSVSVKMQSHPRGVSMRSLVGWPWNGLGLR